MRTTMIIPDSRNSAESGDAFISTGRMASSSRRNGIMGMLLDSKIYQDYERAFSEATGLPVSLQSAGSWHLPHRRKKNENPFCAMMAQKSAACAACLRLNQKLSEAAVSQPKTMACSHGLRETAVPVRTGENLIGFLRIGQVFHKRPTTAQFERVAKRVSAWKLDLDEDRLKEAYFKTTVVSSEKYESMVKILGFFAQHLSAVSNQIAVQQRNQEPPMVVRAKEYIQGKLGDKLSLAEVAKAANASTFYFCKMFKKATQSTFTNYISRVRVEKAKNLLLNPNLRVSEIAYEIGFQSLTHFNRVFRKVAGQSPTEYRAKLPSATAV